MAKPILEVKNLSVKLGEEEIISNLSFNVKPRETLIILGPNGAGKTTLLRALLGVIPYQGEVIWHTEKISYLPPQELLLRHDLPPLSVEDFFKIKQLAAGQIKNALATVGLPLTILKQQFSTLSTGQMQRLVIGWSLAKNPSVLLFDEPTSGIDVEGKKTIYSLLHDFWRKHNLTILLVTHDLNIVWEHGNHVLCLNKKGLCYGAPHRVLSPQKLEELYGTGIKFYQHSHD